MTEQLWICPDKECRHDKAELAISMNTRIEVFCSHAVKHKLHSDCMYSNLRCPYVCVPYTEEEDE